MERSRLWRNSSGLLDISDSYYEAAKVDGANGIKSFFLITLPLLKPTIILAAFLSVTSSLCVMDIIMMMTGGGPNNASMTLVLYAYTLCFGSSNAGFAMAISNVLFLLIFAVAIAGVILTVVVCSFAGYAFAKMDFKGNDAIFIGIVMTMVVPSALILPLPTAFGVFIIRQAILDVPGELVDAAKIDGRGDIKTFIHVIFPLIKSSVLAVAIFTFVGAWNNYIWPLVACTKTEMKTLPLALDMMKTQYNADVGLTMACAVINFLPPFLFYLFTRSKFKESMTLSGIKG